MSVWEKIAEEKIREAMAAGEFDDLPGAGKPLDLSEYFSLPETTRLAFSILKNAGFVPREVELLKEIAALRELLAAAGDEERRDALRREIAEVRLQLDIMLERRRRRPPPDRSIG